MENGLKNKIISCSDMIQAAFSNIEKSTFEKSNKFSSAWEKILTSIKSYDSETNFGQNLFDHSNVVEIKNNILLIEADHPGWIQMFQIYKQYILNGLKMYVPELSIETLAFRLKGSNARLTNVNYDSEFKDESKKMKENIERNEKIIEKYERNNKISEEKNETENKNGFLPDDLLEKFKRMEETAKKRK